MEAVITQLVSHEPKNIKKKDGSGEFTIHIFKDANGAEFQTIKTEIANATYAFVGNDKPLARVCFTAEKKGNFTNNEISFVEGAPAGSTQEDTSKFKYAGGGGRGGGWKRDPEVQKQINRSAALARAIEAHGAGLVSLPNSEQLFALADKFVVYIEGPKTAPEAQGGAVSSDGGGADTGAAAAAPTATAPTAPAAPTDDIPF